MVESNDCIRQYKFEIRTPVLGVIALGVGLCGISLGVMEVFLKYFLWEWLLGVFRGAA